MSAQDPCPADQQPSDQQASNRHLLGIILNPNPQLETENEHILDLPELCPASRNPAPGSTLSVAYTPGERFLELFSLDAYVLAFTAHPVVRDLELFVQTVAEDCAAVLEQPVTVTAHFRLNMVRQSQRITVRVRPSVPTPSARLATPTQSDPPTPPTAAQ